MHVADPAPEAQDSAPLGHRLRARTVDRREARTPIQEEEKGTPPQAGNEGHEGLPWATTERLMAATQ